MNKAVALAKLRELLEGHILGEYDFGVSIAFHTDLTLGEADDLVYVNGLDGFASVREVTLRRGQDVTELIEISINTR